MLYDKDIREPLAFYLEEIYGKNRILEEQVMGQSRADMIMVVHDALYGVVIFHLAIQPCITVRITLDLNSVEGIVYHHDHIRP